MGITLALEIKMKILDPPPMLFHSLGGNTIKAKVLLVKTVLSVSFVNKTTQCNF